MKIFVADHQIDADAKVSPVGHSKFLCSPLQPLDVQEPRGVALQCEDDDRRKTAQDAAVTLQENIHRYTEGLRHSFLPGSPLWLYRPCIFLRVTGNVSGPAGRLCSFRRFRGLQIDRPIVTAKRILAHFSELLASRVYGM